MFKNNPYSFTYNVLSMPEGAAGCPDLVPLSDQNFLLIKTLARFPYNLLLIFMDASRKMLIYLTFPPLYKIIIKI